MIAFLLFIYSFVIFTISVMEHTKHMMKEVEEMKLITQLKRCIRQFGELIRSRDVINLMAKGAIAENVVICNGGGFTRVTL